MKIHGKILKYVNKSQNLSVKPSPLGIAFM